MSEPTLISPAHYTNWMPFIVEETPAEVRITCRVLPKGPITLHASVIAAGFLGFCWLTSVKAPNYFRITVAPGVLTLGGFLTSVIAFYRRQERLGPVFTYDRKSGAIKLPRETRAFRPEEIDCLCLVAGHSADQPVCQLQLRAQSGERILLVPAYHGWLDGMFKTLASSLAIPVRRYVEGEATPNETRPLPH
jgi:hypothetical protein